MFRLILLVLLLASCTKTEEICGIVGERKLFNRCDMGGVKCDCKIWIDDEMVAVDCDTMESVFAGDVVCIEGNYDSFY